MFEAKCAIDHCLLQRVEIGLMEHRRGFKGINGGGSCPSGVLFLFLSFVRTSWISDGTPQVSFEADAFSRSQAKSSRSASCVASLQVPCTPNCKRYQFVIARPVHAFICFKRPKWVAMSDREALRRWPRSTTAGSQQRIKKLSRRDRVPPHIAALSFCRLLAHEAVWDCETISGLCDCACYCSDPSYLTLEA